MGGRKKEVAIEFFSSLLALSVLFFLVFLPSGFAASYTLCTAGCDYENLTAALVAINNTNDFVIVNGSGIFEANSSLTFNFSGNANGSLMVSADHVFLDFNGTFLYGDDSQPGITVNYSTNVTIVDAIAHNFSRGVYVDHSENVTLYNNTVGGGALTGIGSYIVASNKTNVSFNNFSVRGLYGIGLYNQYSNYSLIANNSVASDFSYGFILADSIQNNVTGNNITALNRSGLFFVSTSSEYGEFNHSFDPFNTVNNYPIVYYSGISNSVIENNASMGHLIVAHASNVTLRNLTFPENSTGITLGFVSNTTVTDITMNNASGILFIVNDVNTSILENISISSMGWNSNSLSSTTHREMSSAISRR